MSPARVPSLRPCLATARRQALALLLPGLVACSPGFNWRQVSAPAGGVSLLLPCKPDRAEKTVPLGGRPTPLSMVGCEAEGATFALAVADIGEPGQAPAVLAQWQALTLANMRATAPAQSPAKVQGASPVPAPVRVTAGGRQADGREVQGQALYFARGSQLYQAVIYAPRIDAEAADTFFSGLRLE